jgi:hypothetical protein
LNPSFSHPFLQMIFFPDEWKTLIMEYQSPLLYKNVPAMYVLILISITTLILLVRQHLFGYLFISIVLLSNAAMMVRIVTPAGIVLLCFFAFAMSQPQLKSMMSGASPQRLRIIGFFALIIFLVPLTNSVIQARAAVQNRFAYYFPTLMVE